MTPKRIEILKQMFPKLTRIGVLWNRDKKGAAGQLREAETASQALGIAIEPLNARIPDGLDEVMARAEQANAGAILIICDSSTISNRDKIGSGALRHNLPTMFANKAYLTGGGLMSYGPYIANTFRLAAAYIDKILKGAKPAELPVELPTRFEFVINLKTAKALGITVPPDVRARVDAVTE